MIHTYKQSFVPNDCVFEMAKESAQIYNKAINLHKEQVKFKEIGYRIDHEFEHKFLIAQSKQAAYQQYCTDFKSFLAALKAYNIDPSSFATKPQPPHKEKFINTIYFKKEAIRYKNNWLLLSVKKPNEPIKIKWKESLPLPHFASISYHKFTGWSINLVVNTEDLDYQEDSRNGTMAIDLGVKRIGTTFDGKTVKTYSGKEFLSLGKLRNKLQSKTQKSYANCKKDSRRKKHLKRALRKNVKKIKNKEKDILHKYSRSIVKDAINNGIKTIVIGDCSNIHKKTNLGKENNQKINQNPEQKLKDYVDYKFQGAGRITKVISERRTSKTCPKCHFVHKRSPSGRTFVCKECDYTYDRDGVGSINIYGLEVSFDHDKWLDVIGRMTLPLGIKYHPNLPCSRMTSVYRSQRESCQGKETTML